MTRVYLAAGGDDDFILDEAAFDSPDPSENGDFTEAGVLRYLASDRRFRCWRACDTQRTRQSRGPRTRRSGVDCGQRCSERRSMSFGSLGLRFSDSSLDCSMKLSRLIA